uniref:Uncharacterized protein n=1 Tax=Nelumbo nucifera TaxID=4432 RepID=A0A822ZPY3_NELNU|nr:TPA_asm: hypothetical protein HUJ06_016894 [Nelumbo nucifera]
MFGIISNGPRIPDCLSIFFSAFFLVFFSQALEIFTSLRSCEFRSSD